MTRYQYRFVDYGNKAETLAAVNALGREGWRVDAWGRRWITLVREWVD